MANQFHFPQKGRLPVLGVTLGLIIAVTFLSTQTHPKPPSFLGKTLTPTLTLNPTLTLTLEFAKSRSPTMETINNTEIIWEIPSNPKSVLFIAHGCDGSARNFWVRSTNRCPNCVGLPEETRVELDAIQERYAVLLISSKEPCWTYEEERVKVGRIIKWWVEKHGLGKLPLVGLGASSGGYFLSILATEVKFKAIVLMIASGLYDRMDSIPSGYPATLFVHMPKEVERANKVENHMRFLKKSGVEVEEIKCMEFALSPSWLGERVPGLGQTMSSKVFEAIREKGYVDEKGFMKKDGRVTPWREALKEKKIDLPVDEPHLMDYIQEEMNLGYGFHEMTSLQDREIFEWLDLHVRRQ